MANDLSSAEQDFLWALQLLADGKPLPTAKMTALGRRCPGFAQTRLQVLTYDFAAHPNQQAKLRTVVEVLWAMLGPAKFIEDHIPEIKLPNDAAYHEFVIEQMQSAPQTFGRNELMMLAKRCRGRKVGDEASRLLREHLESVADTLLAQPPGLSENAEQLKHSVRQFGFSTDLNESLAKVQDGLHQSGDGFDQKALLGHLRTFFEKLHQEVGHELHRRKPDTVDKTDFTKFGNLLDHLRAKDVITDKMKEFARGLYGILSNEGVHAMKAQRDYVDVCWIMVIGYGRLLLFELERRVR
jgi:hypothetical protein